MLRLGLSIWMSRRVAAAAAGASNLLMETGDIILLESGDKLLLE